MTEIFDFQINRPPQCRMLDFSSNELSQRCDSWTYCITTRHFHAGMLRNWAGATRFRLVYNLIGSVVSPSAVFSDRNKCHCERSEAISSFQGDCFATLAVTPFLGRDPFFTPKILDKPSAGWYA